MKNKTHHEKHRDRQEHSSGIAPYSIEAYNILISIVQGLALAALFFVISTDKPPDTFLADKIVFWAKVILAFFTICTIWHRYITDNQYIAWKLTVLDTVIPMAFAVFQAFFILAIVKDPIEFAFWITVLFFWGMVAYLNGFLRQKFTKKIHCSHYGEEEGATRWKLSCEYNKKSFSWMCVWFIWALAVTYFLWRTQFSNRTDSIIVLVFGFLSSALELSFDMQKHVVRETK